MNKYDKHTRLTQERVNNIEKTSRGYEVWRDGKIVICQSYKQAVGVVRPTIKHRSKKRVKKVKFVYQDKRGQWWANTRSGLFRCVSKNEAKRYVRTIGAAIVVVHEAKPYYGSGMDSQLWANSRVHKLTRM